MSAAHTPGPWRAVCNSWESSSVYDAEGEVICNVYISLDADKETQNRYEAVMEANARLIAAAPALLDLLCDALEIIDDQLPGEFPAFSTDARAAIALAKGESA